MPIRIIFISLNDEFISLCKKSNYYCYKMKIQDYVPRRKTYYVSPANSLGFMDGGIDMALSRVIFPGVEPKLKEEIKKHGKYSFLGRRYLPIGSSIILPNLKKEHGLISAPTMLLPQDVSYTQNAYYSTKSVLYNLLVNKKETECDIIFTSMCCGIGYMSAENSFNQIKKAIKEYKDYKPNIVNENIIICEPNLEEQPEFYQNTEFKNIPVENIVKVNKK